MPRGPKGEKRPADVIGNAVHVMKIATGEFEEELPGDDGKDKGRAALGRKGGAARAQKHDAGAAGGDRPEGRRRSGGVNAVLLVRPAQDGSSMTATPWLAACFLLRSTSLKPARGF